MVAVETSLCTPHPLRSSIVFSFGIFGRHGKSKVTTEKRNVINMPERSPEELGCGHKSKPFSGKIRVQRSELETNI
jgi:hypothetical protein